MKGKRQPPVDAVFFEEVPMICQPRKAKQLLNQGQAVADMCRALEGSATVCQSLCQHLP